MADTDSKTAQASLDADAENIPREEDQFAVQKPVGRWTRWYRSPLFNVVIVGLISFTQPGIWNALNSTSSPFLRRLSPCASYTHKTRSLIPHPSSLIINYPFIPQYQTNKPQTPALAANKSPTSSMAPTPSPSASWSSAAPSSPSWPTSSGSNAP